MKGIKLEGTSQARNHQINEYIGELGGKKVRRRRKVWGAFGNELSLDFNTQRAGECYSNMSKDTQMWDEQTCFGIKVIVKERPWSQTFDDLAFVTMKAKGQYDSVTHYTLTNCTEACYKKAIVVCVRLTATGQEEYMTAHVAGECPYCIYHENY